VVSVKEKAGQRPCRVKFRETSANEPLMKYRKQEDDVETGGVHCSSRALSGDSPVRPESVQKYLEGKFWGALEDVSRAMLDLAKSLPPSELSLKAYAL
jgi:hypothetical protein